MHIIDPSSEPCPPASSHDGHKPTRALSPQSGPERGRTDMRTRPRMVRQCLAVVAAMAALLLTVVAAPADAATTVVVEGVKATLQNDGDLIVRVLDDNNPEISLLPGPNPGEASLWIGQSGAVLSGAIRDLTVNLGPGDDFFVMGAPISGNAIVKAGAGLDFIPFQGSVAGNAIIDLGTAPAGQHDRLTMQAAFIGGDLTVTGNAGDQSFAGDLNTVLGTFTMRPGAGNSEVRIGDDNYGRFDYAGSRGVDHVLIQFSTNLGDRPTILTSGGGDFVRLVSGTFYQGKLTLNTGSGNDFVRVQAGIASPVHFFINTGTGDDEVQVTFASLVVTPDSVANGGAGNDTFDGEDQALVVRDFETILAP